jgi:rod shape-determining protein MreD
MASTHRGGWLIVLSIFLALVLTALPLPEPVAAWRPEWTAMVLVYWCLALPERIGIGWSWFVGCLQDVLIGSALGAHGLAFAVAAFLTMRLYQRLRVFPVWQQALAVLVLLLLIRLLLFWIGGLLGRPSPGWTYWLPALTGTAVWPFIFVVLRNLRRRFGVC